MAMLVVNKRLLAVLAPSVILAASGAVAALIFLTAQGGDDSLFAGVPNQTFDGVELRRAEGVGAISVSRSEAVTIAAAEGIGAPEGTVAVSLEEQLLWMRDDSSPSGERLVWGINFADPESVSIDPGVPGCSVDRTAVHVIVFIDAITADFVSAVEAYAPMDLSSICPNAPFPAEPVEPAEPGETLAP